MPEEQPTHQVILAVGSLVDPGPPAQCPRRPQLMEVEFPEAAPLPLSSPSVSESPLQKMNQQMTSGQPAVFQLIHCTFNRWRDASDRSGCFVLETIFLLFVSLNLVGRWNWEISGNNYVTNLQRYEWTEEAEIWNTVTEKKAWWTFRLCFHQHHSGSSIVLFQS